MSLKFYEHEDIAKQSGVPYKEVRIQFGPNSERIATDDDKAAYPEAWQAYLDTITYAGFEAWKEANDAKLKEQFLASKEEHDPIKERIALRAEGVQKANEHFDSQFSQPFSKEQFIGEGDTKINEETKDV